MLTSEADAARRRIPEAIRQAYSIVVTVNESNDVHAFKVTVADEPLFTTIKADKRARIQETAISSEAMMPGGPYDLWREGETSRRVKDLVGAFAQFPKLPKMLRRKEILDTVVQGVQEGIWVAQLVRPDRSVRTFWRMPIDQPALKDSGLEVLLPEAASVSELAPELLAYKRLPGLWTADELTVEDATAYFAGGHQVTVPREGYDDTIVVPKCDASAVEAAVGDAVAHGTLWLTNGPTSILGEPIPADVLTPTATLQPPPSPIGVDELMSGSIPGAWKDGTTNALAISTALSAKLGKTLPWPTVRTAIDSAIRARWIELVEDGATWPCDLAATQHAVLRVPAGRDLEEEAGGTFSPRPKGLLVAESALHPNGIQDLADQIPAIAAAAVGHDLKFHVRVEFGGETPPNPSAVDEINALLAQVAEDMKLG